MPINFNFKLLLQEKVKEKRDRCCCCCGDERISVKCVYVYNSHDDDGVSYGTITRSLEKAFSFFPARHTFKKF